MSYGNPNVAEYSKQNIQDRDYSGGTQATGDQYQLKSALELINARLIDLGDAILKDITRIEEIADKAFGPATGKGGSTLGAVPVANGDIDRIEQTVSDLLDRAHRLTAVANRLERL